MANYNSGISRATGGASDPLVPEPVSAQIIQDLPAASAVLTNARRVTMSALTDRLPVLDALPQAYFVNGDQGLKQTSSQDWKNLTLVAEELAVIIPVPQAYLDDADVPVWDEVRPRIVEAFGALIDETCLFTPYGGISGSTWANPIVPTAVANTEVLSEGVQLSSALSTGAAITALPVNALPDAVVSGGNVVVSSGSNSQTFVASAAASAGATSIAVTSATPNYAYPKGSTVAVPVYSNAVVAGSGVDLGVDIANLAKKLAEQGQRTNAFAIAPGFDWQLRNIRAQGSGMPIFSETLTLQNDRQASIYGQPLPELANGAWDPSQALLVAGDWSKAIVGLRQDISFTMHEDGVISDDNGKVVLNLMQQDSVALRAVMRVAFQVARPANRMVANPYPFGALVPAGGLV